MFIHLNNSKERIKQHSDVPGIWLKFINYFIRNLAGPRTLVLIILIEFFNKLETHLQIIMMILIKKNNNFKIIKIKWTIVKLYIAIKIKILKKLKKIKMRNVF